MKKEDELLIAEGSQGSIAEEMVEHLAKLEATPKKRSEPIWTSFEGDGYEEPRLGR